MKILILITHGNIGGATNFVYFLAKGLKEKNIEIKVGFGEGDYLKEKLKNEKINYINFKWLKRTHNILSNLFFVFEIKKLLNKEKFDIIHFNSTNTLFGAIGAKLSKTKPKTIFTFHGLSILDTNYKKYLVLKYVYWLVFKILLNFIDTTVFVSQTNLDFAKKIKLINKGILIYNGIPKPNFLPKEEARFFFEDKLNISLKNKFIIGSVGRLDYQKNYEFLIRNFPKILKIKPNSICVIIGDGPEKNKLKELIKKLKLENFIFLIGELQNANQYLKGFDLFVLTSRYEGLPIVLIEAVLAEIPVIATNVGGNKEIINNENIFELNNDFNFIEKIKNITKSSNLNKDKFNIEIMIDNYLKLFKTLINSL